MSVSPLREITLGVRDLATRARQFEQGFGLRTLAEGPMTPITAGRLFDLHTTPRASLLGRPDIADAPRLRLVEVPGTTPARANDLRGPGPLGIGFTTPDPGAVQQSLETLGVPFGPEGLGNAEDGDVLAVGAGSGSTLPDSASFVVTNLDACLHFMQDALEQTASAVGGGLAPPFHSLGGLPPAAFRLVTTDRPGERAGRVAFIEFERRLEPMSQTPGLARGVCRIRYDTDDLHSTLARVPGGGGALVRGPASIDDPVLGRALVAMVRAPFGVLVELWQTS